MHVLIPSLTGKPCSVLERKLLSLPPRLGGLGIINPTEISQFEFNYTAPRFHTPTSVRRHPRSRKAKETEVSQAREQMQKTQLDGINSEIGNDPLKLRLLETHAK